MTVEPIYFGSAGARAFAWLHRPDAPTGLGVVLCPPLGYEAVQAQRPLRHLAEQLCARGHHVLRLDYPGTGDAEGIDEGDSVDGWVNSIVDALAELRAEGCGTLALYGLRSGALLAAVCAATHPVDALVLHALPTSGRHFIRELRAFRRMAAASGLDDPSLLELDPKAEEVAGYVLWGATVATLSAIDLATRPDVPRCLFVAREDLATDEAVVAKWSSQGDVTRIEPGGYAAMMQDPHKAEVPDAAWSAIASWLDELPRGRVGTASTTRTRELEHVAAVRIDARRVSMTDVHVHERPIRYGENNRLFGILTEPVGEATREPILLLNSGAVHRVGPNRMHVVWARAWAAAGHRVLRADIGGIGDSMPPPGQPENLTYSPTGVADVQAAVDELAHRDPRPPTLIGICSGAYVAFHAARSARIGRAVLINPQTFDYKEGDSLEVSSARVASEFTHYRRSLFSSEKWKKLASGGVNLGHLAEIVLGRARSVLETRVENLRRRFLSQVEAEGPLGSEIRRVADRTKLVFVFSDGDPGLDYIDRHAGEAIRRLRREAKVVFDLVTHADHTFTPPESQRRLFALLSSYLTG
ncbi:MAG: alpha/beta fold hydrolase [Polyangia bacterium]